MTQLVLLDFYGPVTMKMRKISPFFSRTITVYPVLLELKFTWNGDWFSGLSRRRMRVCGRGRRGRRSCPRPAWSTSTSAGAWWPPCWAWPTPRPTPRRSSPPSTSASTKTLSKRYGVSLFCVQCNGEAVNGRELDGNDVTRWTPWTMASRRTTDRRATAPPLA